MAAVAEKDAVAVVVEKDVAEVVVEKVVAGRRRRRGRRGLVRPNTQTSIGATRANTIVYAYEKNAIHN